MNETGNAIVELSLSAEALSAGGKFEVAFDRRSPCTTCKGIGRKEGAPACEKCSGKGTIPRVIEGSDPPITITPACDVCEGRGHAAEHACPECERGFTKANAKVEVEVPSHSRAGEQLRLKEQGHLRADGSKSDVIVVLGRNAEPPPTIRSNPVTLAMFVIVAFLVLLFAILSFR